ncbi:UNVERIFIED_CONTAM: hypothetical protein K2H54_043682 [Gekko kuhli]
MYSRSSQVTVPSAEAETNAYTCIVKHSAIKKPEGEKKRIESKECAKRQPTPIRVRLLTPDCDAENTETDLELICVLLSSGPGQAKVEWLINGVVEQTKEAVKLSQQESSGYSSYITQNITKKSWDEGNHYACRVTQLPKNQNAEMYNTSKCKACYKSVQVPTISITKPSYRDLVEGTATVTCLVEGFFLEKIQITWNVDGRPSTMPQPDIVKTDAGRRPNAKSSHSVSLQQWRKGTTFQCKVTTMCLEEITKGVTIKKDTQKQTMTPVITISQTYRDTSSNSTIAQILVCDVNGFFPMEISISWKKNSIPMNTSLYDNGPVVSSGAVYATYSILKIGRSKGGSGRDSYGCVVHHSSSPKPITADEEVSSDSPKPQAPTVELLQSVDQEKKTVTQKCVASDYWPGKVTINWRGSLSKKAAIFKEQKMLNGRYTASSQIEITFSQWQEVEDNTCEVVHEESKFTSLKKVSRKDWIGSIVHTPLTLSLSTNPHCPSLDLSDNRNITLLCSINGYMENIEVTWEAGGKVQKSLKMDRPRGKGDQFHTTSNLTVPLKEWNELQEYTSCKGSIPPPSLYLLMPSLEGLLIQRKALLTCLVVGYELDHGILTWMVGGVKDSKNSIMGNVTNHKNATQSLESQLVITGEVWNSGSQVQCTVSHSCSLFPEKREMIQHIKEEILFRWKKNSSDVDPSEYFTGAPEAKDGSPTFTAQSNLKIPSSEWKSRILYTCMVGHESSPDMYNIRMFSVLINTTTISIQPPSFEDLFTNKSAALTCRAPLADAMMNWTVLWLMDGQPANTQAVTTEVLNKTTDTAWICSRLVVNLTEWKGTIKFTCRISTGLGEVTQFYKRKHGTMKSPKVSLQQQSSKEDLNVTLFCIATDFYPEEVFVKWQEEKTEMSLKGHDAHDLKCDHERERCSLLSILEVPKSQWIMGVSYTCLVAHVSSPNIIFRRANSHSDSWDCAATSADIYGICNETDNVYSELSEMDGAWNRVSTYLILFLTALFYGGLVTFFKVK